MGRKSSTESQVGDVGDTKSMNNILFDPIKGEIDTISGHRRWVHEAIERRIKKAMNTGCIDLSSSSLSSFIDGQRSFQLHLLPSELSGSVSRLAWARQHLKKLYLTNNIFSILSPEIISFQQLKILGMGGNVLGSLPSDIGNLLNLEYLYIENNQLSTIPDSLQNCKKLLHISMGSNSFHDFPLVLTKCKSLLYLGMSSNQLRSIPIQIRHLTRLIDLDLDYNHIGPTLPDEISYLQRLERLGLAGNNLASVPTSIINMNLSNLRLSGNRAPGYIVSDPLTGDVIDGLNIPIRFDGYMQLRQSICVLSPETKQVTKKITAIEGVFPVALRNLENGLDDLNKDKIERKILHGRQ